MASPACSSPPRSSSTPPIAQSTSLGFPSVARVFTPHPIQDRTDDEMIAYADAAFDEILAGSPQRPDCSSGLTR